MPRLTSSCEVGVVVAADVADIQPACRCVVIGPVGVAQTERPDRVDVRPVAVVERVVGRNRPVRIDPMELPARTRQRLRRRALKVIARREVELPLVAEHDRPAVMALTGTGGVLRILVEDQLAARDRAGQRGIGREPRQPITGRRLCRVEDVVVVVGANCGSRARSMTPLSTAEPGGAMFVNCKNGGGSGWT